MKRSLKINPELKPCSWEEIKGWRDTHEASPIATSFGLFDANEISTLRLQEAIDQFDNLPTVSEGKLTWKLGDNSFLAMTKAELQSVLTEIKLNRGIRSSLLHVKAEEFNQMQFKPNRQNLSAISFWGIS